MNKVISSLLLAFTLLASAGSGAIAAEKPKATNVIEKIDEKSKTITIYVGPNKTATYKVPDAARITVNNKPAEFKDLKPQMKAFVGHKAGSDTADSVNAHALLKPKSGGRHK